VWPWCLPAAASSSDTLENRISAIPHALTHASNAHTGNDFAAAGYLNGPLGLAVLPGGDILAVNANDGRVVRITPSGGQSAAPFLDHTGTPPGAGTLFGLAVAPDGKTLYFVDDGMNNLRTVDSTQL
jgi:DNA-binding beta-propeller fold protein YncE